MRGEHSRNQNGEKEMKTLSKAEIRKVLNITHKGKMQINFHGAGKASVLIFAKKGTAEYNTTVDMITR
jgi:hypothetical protein